ncbi:MAG: hypothetical protein IT318_12785 [Anaerolineales bacterium]|nr:hypothetical protein [Anaerolineales bacterium]
MADLNTRSTRPSAADLISRLPDKRTRQDCQTLLALMWPAARAEPERRGSSMAGFGRCHFKHAGECWGDWSLTGFAPRPDLPIRAARAHLALSFF